MIHLRNLEIELHQPSARSNPERLDELLHPSFFEFGKSGNSFGKQDILGRLPLEESTGSIWSADYELTLLFGNVVLLTYKSAHADDHAVLSQHALRSSIWQRTAAGWQMRFHQGTPAPPFINPATI